MASNAVGARRKRYNRAQFLTRAAGSTLALAMGPGLTHAAAELKEQKGKTDTRIRRWAVITIGNLSRNRYWGESDAKGVRSAICTCTLVEADGFRLLVDPSLASADEMARELDRRSGLRPSDITAIFITHEHADHYAGLGHFAEARWFAGPDVARLLNATNKWAKHIDGVSGRLLDVLDIVPTPGHTMGLNSLRFDCHGRSVAVVGDAVATEDFWRDRRGYFNCMDFELSAKSMDKIAGLADLVVPGHDNYFQSMLHR